MSFHLTTRRVISFFLRRKTLEKMMYIRSTSNSSSRLCKMEQIVANYDSDSDNESVTSGSTSSSCSLSSTSKPSHGRHESGEICWAFMPIQRCKSVVVPFYGQLNEPSTIEELVGTKDVNSKVYKSFRYKVNEYNQRARAGFFEKKLGFEPSTGHEGCKQKEKHVICTSGALAGRGASSNRYWIETRLARMLFPKLYQ